MSNYVFACASVNGLTLAQKRETVKALREGIKRDVAARKEAKAAAKVEKAAARDAKKAARAEKAVERAAKKAARIAALEAKLAKMKAPNPKKPGKVTVFKGAEAEARLAA